MEPADATSVLGDFGDVTFRYFGRETRFSRRGSSFLVTTENQQGKAETFKVAYTLGYAPLQQYLVAFAQLPPNGQQLISLLIADPPLPYADISARLGIPVGSIGPNRSRYLDKMRRHPAVAALINA